ncbi:MAG: rod shape-determining protein MreC, partial [Holosporaceae bacterium]|nr:rod shape-determining protein MreC [Holosporaceae bacterium]
MPAGNCFIEKCRFFINSTTVVLYRYAGDLESAWRNLNYFISQNVDGVLINLHNENFRLREEVENLKSLRSENERLRELLSLKEATQFSSVAAEVVNVFSNDFIQSCVINVGETDGISVNDPVKNSDGLVGRIIEVHKTWSKTLLITDVNSSIPVKIGERQINAIMVGTNSDKLFLSTVQEDIRINEGDDVKTSRYGIKE